ncbi:MAG: hypothetical protein GY816_14920 [Cytophagales bacterium]|nr:hypothetical protein [Cytophagales bacterium]
MRKIYLLTLASVLYLITGTHTFSQNTVNALKIMEDIREGNNISYSGVTIKGGLDFTYRNSKEDKLGTHKWWDGSNTVNEEIEVEISFNNCTFEDDVLAYIHVDRSGYTFTADFEESVTFKNCDFKGKAMFKYSEFDEVVTFEGSKFNRENSFKYAEFDQNANFSSTMFDDDAIFKYTEFENGVSFNGAEFRESLNIKYLDVSGMFDIDRMEVEDDIDAKYTEINGESFTKYLYKSRKN